MTHKYPRARLMLGFVFPLLGLISCGTDDAQNGGQPPSKEAGAKSCPEKAHATGTMNAGACTYVCDADFTNQGTATDPICELAASCTHDYCAGEQIRSCDVVNGILAAPADCENGGSCVEGVCCGRFDNATAAVDQGACTYSCDTGFTNQGTPDQPDCQPEAGACTQNTCAGEQIRICDPATGTLAAAADCEDNGSCVDGLCCPQVENAMPSVSEGACAYTCIEGYANTGTPTEPVCKAVSATPTCPDGSYNVGPVGAPECMAREDLVMKIAWPQGYSRIKLSVPGVKGQRNDIDVDCDGDGEWDLEHFHGPYFYCRSGDSAGPHDIVIRGYMPRLLFWKIPVEITQWGKNPWVSTAWMFRDVNVIISASDTPNLTKVRTMRGMFNKANFNDDISTWDVSNVTDMAEMFASSTFNKDLSKWNVGNVVDMHSMFAYARFNQDISKWDVSKVTNMESMFEGSSAFNGAISGWDVGEVVNMSKMFERSKAFNQDISKWNVSKVKTMAHMFYDAQAFNNGGAALDNWDARNVTTMTYMFSHSGVGDLDMRNWNTEKLTTTSYMFFRSPKFNGDMSGWNTPSLGTIAHMFDGARAFNGDMSDWDVSHVTDMRHLFNNASAFNQPLANWDVSRARNMARMFDRASSFNQDISAWNTGRVTTMQSMFNFARAFNHDISGWDVGQVREWAWFAFRSGLTRDHIPPAFL